MSSKPFSVRMITACILLALTIGGVGYAVYRYVRMSQDLASIQSNPARAQEVASASNKKIVEDIGKVFALPQGEEPTIALVSDVEKLRDKPFFASAQNGDHVLIYSQAKKAILYRPSEKKIIDVAPVNLDGSESSQASATNGPTPTPQPLTVILRNGSRTVGITKTYENTLKTTAPELSVLDTENAKSKTFTSSIIVDVSGKYKDAVEMYAKKLGLTVSELPSTEPAPKSDILIILGADQKK